MSENDHKANRLPLSMYCQRSAIVGFGDEKDLAERVLETSLAGRICICILPILEDKKHYYLQCNFKRSPDDIGDFKIVNTLDLIVNQGVLPTLDVDHGVDAYLFLTKEALEDFAGQADLREISGKFELISPQIG
jgi:hypothetical protein